MSAAPAVRRGNAPHGVGQPTVRETHGQTYGVERAAGSCGGTGSERLSRAAPTKGAPAPTAGLWCTASPGVLTRTARLWGHPSGAVKHVRSVHRPWAALVRGGGDHASPKRSLLANLRYLAGTCA